MNTKRHAVTAGQVSDYTGARALVSSVPAADWVLGDRGYDADWFREDLVNMGITPCIPGESHVKSPSNMTSVVTSGATRYDRCPKVCAIALALALAATVIFWL